MLAAMMRITLLCLLLLLSPACAVFAPFATAGEARRPARAAAGDVASFYGYESGRRTANGERFDPMALTCAHPSLPFNTRLRVTYRGRSVVCRVNDRGPFVKGRTIDLSLGAAMAIGLVARGVDRVTVERMF